MTDLEKLRKENDELQQKIQQQLVQINARIDSINNEMRNSL